MLAVSLYPFTPPTSSDTSLGIEDVGALEYFQIKPILNRIDSVDQLRRIELASPQIMGDDAEIWQKFIARDIPNWKSKNYAPKNPVKWYEVYCKYRKEQKEEIERDQAVLRETLMGLQKKREEKNSRIEDLKNLPKVPRDPRMIANNGGVPLRGRAGVKAASSLTWTAGSKTKMTDGKSVLNRARKEAMEISARSKLAKPTTELGGRIGQVMKAPAGMAREYRIAAQPAVKILSKKRIAVFDSEPRLSNVSGPSLEEREERLRQAMKAKTSGGVKRTADDKIKQNQTLVGSSDEDSHSVDDSDLDDIFDSPKPTMITRPVAAASRPMKPMPASASKKPSDVISMMLSRKPTAAVIRTERNPVAEKKSAIGSQSVPQARNSHPLPTKTVSSPAPPTVRGDSPESRDQKQPMMMPRKRKEVDIFNRRPSKKPRPS